MKGNKKHILRGREMIIAIYDFQNDTKEITLPDKEIVEIFISILSGDETGFVKFVDGTKIKFDASDSRFTDFYDGMYTVEGENIKRWIDFKPSGNRTASYERRYIFDTEDEHEDAEC